MIGGLSSVLGLGLIARYGVTFHTRFEFRGAQKPSNTASAEAWHRHRQELRGRFGLLLAVIGALLSAASTGLVYLPF